MSRNFTRLIFIIFYFIICGSVYSQTCLTEGIRFTSQSQIDNFAMDFPGCIIIEGNLTIGDPEIPYDDNDIVSLEGLSQITAILGDIIISGNDQLTDLEGLENLTVIEGDLTVQSNSDLQSFRGLDNVTTIKGSLNVKFNGLNLKLYGLEKLKIIKGSVDIIDNFTTGLNGMNNIDSIYGDFKLQSFYFTNFLPINKLRYIGGGLVLYATGVDNMLGLENLTQLGSLYLSNNDNISLNGLNNVSIIHGSMTLRENDGVSMGGLGASLTEIGGDLYVSMSNAGIHNLTALKRIGGYLYYSLNHLTTTFTGPPNLTYLGGVYIDNNHLLTSISGFTKVDTIAGNVTFFNLRELQTVSVFPNLKVLSGEYRANTNRKLQTLNNLNQLKVLGGIHIEDNELLTNIPEFPELDVLNGRIRIYLNDKVKSIHFPEDIVRIPGDVDLFGNSELHLISGFSNLKSVGGDFIIYINTSLDTINAFTKLDSIGGKFRIDLSHAVTDFPRVNRFKYIGKEILYTALDIEDLSSLHDLDSINGELYISSCNDLKNLNGIEHITSLGGLGLGALKNIHDLHGLGNLKLLKGNLTIINCDSLTSLQELSGINSVKGYIYISHNDNLLTLHGIHNIDPQSIKKPQFSSYKDIEVKENSKLSICNLPNICSAIREHKKTFTIYNNAPGCDNVQELECKDYGLSGNVFYDRNQNKQKDVNELGIPGVKISLQPGNKKGITDETGNYLVLASEGEVYTIIPDEWDGWEIITDSLQFTRIFNAGAATNSNNDFGLFPEKRYNNIEANLSSDATRCNETVTFYMRYQNTGTDAMKGRVKLSFDDRILYSSASVSPFNIDWINNIITWKFDTLQPFEQKDLNVMFKMPNQNFAGESFDFTLTAIMDSAGLEVIKDVSVYSPVILCSFDPNDKIVTPPGVRQENFTLIQDLLTYTVRFQNTGNSHAIDITIVDTLDNNLDVSTMKVVNSSFPVVTTVNGQVVTFFFREIWLPDSLSNEAESHGFVSYEIKPLGVVEDLSQVRNEARIIFDFNDPIVTNQTLNTLVKEICDDVVTSIDTVICEGESYLGFTESGIYQDTFHIGSTCDSVSQIILEVLPAGSAPCLTGIDPLGEVDINVFPNPVKTQVNIVTTKNIQFVGVYTPEGIHVSSPVIKGNKNIISFQVKEWPDGIYILMLIIEGKKYFSKIVVSGTR